MTEGKESAQAAKAPQTKKPSSLAQQVKSLTVDYGAVVTTPEGVKIRRTRRGIRLSRD